MNRYNLQLTNLNWSYGSYRRRDYKKAMIYTFHQYKDFSVMYNMSSGKITVQDGIADAMYQDGLISEEAKREYDDQLLAMFARLDGNDEPYIETLYETIQKKRKNKFGYALIEKEQCLLEKKRCTFDSTGGIDQSRKKEDLLNVCQSVIMILTQPELFFLMEEDILKWTKQGKDVYLVANVERGYDIPAKVQLEDWLKDFLDSQGKIYFLNMKKEELNLGELDGSEELNHQIEQGKTCLYFYGIDGLLHCRNLKIPSVVHGIPKDYFTKSFTNQHGTEKAAVVYVPENFDIVKWVSMIERTRISYWQMARLWENYGDAIYHMEPEELYLRYPQYFLNIYANGPECIESKEGYPIQIQWPAEYMITNNNQNTKSVDLEKPLPDKKVFINQSIFSEFDKQKDQAIKDYLNGFDNYEYHSTYFNENLKEIEIPWFQEEQQNGILVQAIRINKAGNSYVNFCKEGETVRKFLEQEEKKEFGLSVFSNFLFFLTPRLAQLYNDLRTDRPREWLPYEKGHLDYMLYEKDGKRIETFPLFRKACIALMKNGQFLFFNFNMGGGEIQLDKDDQKATIKWDKDAVNPELLEENDRDIYVYTPSYAKAESDIDIKDYRVLVGENRVNFVIFQNQILCLRKGSVVLSSVGVVISLNNKMGNELIKTFGLKELEDGYFDCSNLDFSVRLNKPEEVKEEEWNQVLWAYGGGLSLILDGVGLCEGNHMEEWLSKEGWMSPMSRQTQESAIHLMVKHPRTAIGITKNGDLVVLVYSGRVNISSGADYNEMCQIAKKLFPDIWSMMNVDGGGSAMLGIGVGNSFMELSYPATSFESCAGMVRPINTVLCLK